MNAALSNQMVENLKSLKLILDLNVETLHNLETRGITSGKLHADQKSYTYGLQRAYDIMVKGG